MLNDMNYDELDDLYIGMSRFLHEELARRNFGIIDSMKMVRKFDEIRELIKERQHDLEKKELRA
ncbi:hypothetical protein [Selenomonas ruminis]|uniref:Uncharacterized protein n=1 Tax=Selenomonas ruminis TaxID=2593411 RepID=A0A5D6W900_9FIRM|nr:hypothetical protein [Selenomonas sp. mPRGC5]TYZ24961.1 hypothetical protein FZ040_02680 [Selenomonas sp. mPRGC5]